MNTIVGHVISEKSQELCNKGTQAYSESKFDVAYIHYMAAIAADDRNYNAWMNLAAVLSNMQKAEASEAASRRAIALDPTDIGKYNNLANSIMQQRRYDESIAIYKKVLVERPDDGGVHHNIGMAYHQQEKFEISLKHLEESVRLRGNVFTNRNDLAMTELALGDLQKGLADFEIRWITLHKCAVWDSGIAEWKGQTLEGKRIIVHHEQGFGDSIMLARFIPELLIIGAKVTIAMPKELIRLFAHNFSSCKVLAWDEPVIPTDYDFHSPMLSMMRWLNYPDTERISSLPYITSPETFELDVKGKIKVGLCWASGDHGYQMSKRRRIIQLEKFLPLASLPDVKIYALQKGKEEKDIEFAGAHSLVYNALARAEDFADTADVIAKLDVVISVDSAVAHLAAAMGKPVIMLSPFPRCWRWWGKYHGAPWYRDMAIVQQDEDGSWDDAVEEALEAFNEWFF